MTTLSRKSGHRASFILRVLSRVWQEWEWRIDDVTGTRVAAVLDDRVTLFDASHPESEALELKAAGPVTSVSYSPDGESIVIVDENSTVSLWDTSAATTVWTIEHDEPHVKTAFAPDSSFLAIWESDPSTGREDDPPDSDLRIVAVDSGEVVHGPTTFEEDLIRVWISPSQEFFATADYAGGFQMWDLAEGAPYGPRVGSEISHDELLWGPDDEFFVTLGTGGARAWPTPWDIDAACQMASPFVSEERLREHLPDDWEIRSCLGRDG